MVTVALVSATILGTIALVIGYFGTLEACGYFPSLDVQVINVLHTLPPLAYKGAAVAAHSTYTPATVGLLLVRKDSATVKKETQNSIEAAVLSWIDVTPNLHEETYAFVVKVGEGYRMPEKGDAKHSIVLIVSWNPKHCKDDTRRFHSNKIRQYDSEKDKKEALTLCQTYNYAEQKEFQSE